VGGDGGRRGRDDVASDRVIEVEKRRGRRARPKNSLVSRDRNARAKVILTRIQTSSTTGLTRAAPDCCSAEGFFLSRSRSRPRDHSRASVQRGPPSRSAMDPLRLIRDAVIGGTIEGCVRSARRTPRVSSSWRSPFRAPRPTSIAVPRLTLPILPPFRASDPRPMRRTSTSTSARPSRARRRPTTRRR